jgi:hypothetical protein
MRGRRYGLLGCSPGRGASIAPTGGGCTPALRLQRAETKRHYLRGAAQAAVEFVYNNSTVFHLINSMTTAARVALCLLLCTAAYGQSFDQNRDKGSADGQGSKSSTVPASPPARAPQGPAATPPPIQSPNIANSGDASSSGYRAPAALSKTQVIIISSCVAGAIAVVVVVGIVVRRRRLANFSHASPQIVIGGAQLYCPPAASAPPLEDCPSNSLEFMKPAANQPYDPMRVSSLQ